MVGPVWWASRDGDEDSASDGGFAGSLGLEFGLEVVFEDAMNG